MKNKFKVKLTKRNLVFFYMIVLLILALSVYLFQNYVKKQLWEQSVTEIMELTRQGTVTLQVQIKNAFDELHKIKKSVKNDKAINSLSSFLSHCKAIDKDIYIYFSNGEIYDKSVLADKEVSETLKKIEADTAEGIINPHTSSSNGARVFNIYVTFHMDNGKKAFLVREFKINEITDTFTLNYYGDDGFTYITDSNGEILIRPTNTLSNLTMHNIFEVLSSQEGNQETKKQLKEVFKTGKTGWATVNFQDKQTFLGYRPIGYESDWYLVSVILTSQINKAANNIIVKTFILLFIVITLAVSVMSFSFKNNILTEKKLENQTSYMSRLFNTVPNGVALLKTTPPYEHISINKSGLILLGYEQNTKNEKYKTLLETVCDEDIEKMKEIFSLATESGQKQEFECRVPNKNGKICWLMGLVEKNLDSSGNEVLITAFKDTTAIKEAEIKAKIYREHERTILMTAVAETYPIIASLDLTEDNSQFIYTKYPLPRVFVDTKKYSDLYKTLLSRVHFENLTEFSDKFSPENLAKGLLKEQGNIWADIKISLDNGEYHWFSFQILRIKDKSDNNLKAVFLAKNSDEQKVAEEEQRAILKDALMVANAANNAKSKFLSDMSHDIRTPMNAIMGMTTIVLAKLEDKEFVKDGLNKIMLSSKHLLSLINNILDMSKIESGKISLNKEEFNYPELISNMVELIRPQATEAMLKIEVNLAETKQEKVIGDVLRLKQIYLNILSNAVKYSKKGGSIYIEAKDEPSKHKEMRNFVFRCVDTGIGMSNEFLEHLFEPFERARDSTLSKINGTGLGMAITKNLIDLLGGTIHVESEQGKGTEFIVVLPFEVKEEKEESLPNSWKVSNCLIIDNDPKICKAMAQTLEDLAISTDFVSSRAIINERLEAIEKSFVSYDIVILDYEIDNSLQLALKIKNALNNSIIILSAYDTSEISQNIKNFGVSACLTKPFYRTKFLSLLKEIKENTADNINENKKISYKGHRVLLVDDNKLNREILKALIEEFEIEVIEAENGEEAVEKVKGSSEGYFDIIFMDIKMPIMDGYEATKLIRGLNRNDVSQIPIIAVTANAFDDDVRKALNAGMDRHYSKPVEKEKLERVLEELLK